MEFIIIILIGAFIFCIWGLIQSLKNEKQRKKMQKAADLSYKTQNGKYYFHYIIKGFDDANGKLIKVLIDPVLGFSDLSSASTNSCHSAIVTVKSIYDSNLTKTFTFEYSERSLKPDISFILDKEFYINNVYGVEIVVQTVWNLGSNTVNEKFSFKYER